VDPAAQPNAPPSASLDPANAPAAKADILDSEPATNAVELASYVVLIAMVALRAVLFDALFAAACATVVGISSAALIVAHAIVSVLIYILKRIFDVALAVLCALLSDTFFAICTAALTVAAFLYIEAPSSRIYIDAGVLLCAVVYVCHSYATRGSAAGVDIDEMGLYTAPLAVGCLFIVHEVTRVVYECAKTNHSYFLVLLGMLGLSLMSAHGAGCKGAVAACTAALVPCCLNSIPVRFDIAQACPWICGNTTVPA
jgi:hypothetical protein